MYDQYFCLKPINNEMLKLLEDLKNYRVKLINLEEELSSRNINSLPKEMESLRVIIEFTDCIIQAKDLKAY